MDGGEAVDQVVDMRGEEGFEWFSEIHMGMRVIGECP